MTECAIYYARPLAPDSPLLIQVIPLTFGRARIIVTDGERSVFNSW